MIEEDSSFPTSGAWIKIFITYREAQQLAGSKPTIEKVKERIRKYAKRQPKQSTLSLWHSRFRELATLAGVFGPAALFKKHGHPITVGAAVWGGRTAIPVDVFEDLFNRVGDQVDWREEWLAEKAKGWERVGWSSKVDLGAARQRSVNFIEGKKNKKRQPEIQEPVERTRHERTLERLQYWSAYAGTPEPISLDELATRAWRLWNAGSARILNEPSMAVIDRDELREIRQRFVEDFGQRHPAWEMIFEDSKLSDDGLLVDHCEAYIVDPVSQDPRLLVMNEKFLAMRELERNGQLLKIRG